MRKQLTVAVLLLALLCQTFSRYVVMAGFYMNRSYIASNLCVNRDKPQLHCNGKCHLKEQLTEEERKDQENPERKADNKNEIFCNNILNGNLLPPITWINNPRYHPGCIGFPIDRPATIFHPPLV